MRVLICCVLLAHFLNSVSVRAAESAELIIHHANVHTGDKQVPRCTAVAISNGKILSVGNFDELKKYVGKETRLVDAQSKWILPGFIDAHAHPQPIYPEFSRWYVIDAGPDNCATLEDLIAAIKRKAKLVPRGQWILGRGYQETKLGRHPTKMDLDLGTTAHPVLITHSSGHLAVCNSAALKSAGISAKSRDPSGGAFDRDKNGEPTGLLKESAVGLVRRANPAGDKPPEYEVIAAYRTCFKQFLAKGITSVHVAGISPDSAQLMQAAHKKGAPIRLMFMLRENYLDEAIRLKNSMAKDELNFRFGAIKLFHGNSLSGQTCWLSKPYAHRPDYFGIPPARSQESLNKLILRIHQAGLQACVHANGDREISMLLDAYEYVLKEVPRQNHRHRIEHCSVVTQKILDRIKDLELVVAPHSYVYEHGDKMENYGEARWDWMHANRSMIDQGTVVAGNSDYPVSSAIPMLRIHDLVNRTSIEGKVYGPKQKCTVEQSIRAFTFGGAYAEFMESKKGTIAPGMLADMVVLDADPMNTPANKLKDIQVLQTFVGGKQVYPEIQ